MRRWKRKSIHAAESIKAHLHEARQALAGYRSIYHVKTGHWETIGSGEHLVPMLRNGHCISPDNLIEDGDAFVERFVLPKTESKTEFLARFAKADYAPELFFEGTMLEAAKANPEALWKLVTWRRWADK